MLAAAGPGARKKAEQLASGRRESEAKRAAGQRGRAASAIPARLAGGEGTPRAAPLRGGLTQLPMGLETWLSSEQTMWCSSTLK